MLNLRVTTIGKTSYLQQLAGDSPHADYTTLRPISPILPEGGPNPDPTTCVFIVGTPSAHTAYTLQDLIDHSHINSLTHAAYDSDDMEYFAVDKSPLGDTILPALPSTPLPPMLSTDLSDAQYEALILRMLGLPTKHLTDETKQAISDTLHQLHYMLVPPAHMAPLLAVAGWGQAQSLDANQTPSIESQSLDATPTLSTESQSLDANQTPSTPSTESQSLDATPTQFVITKLTDDEKAALMRHTRKRSETAPRSWPWKNMEVWDKVVIPSTLAVRAQRAVHSYSAVSGKQFKTKKLSDGTMQVTRIDGSRMVKRMLG